jgi:hypothetical protein
MKIIIKKEEAKKIVQEELQRKLNVKLKDVSTYSSEFEYVEDVDVEVETKTDDEIPF